MIRTKLDGMYEETVTASGKKAEIYEVGFIAGHYWYRLRVEGELVCFGTLPKVDYFLTTL